MTGEVSGFEVSGVLRRVAGAGPYFELVTEGVSGDSAWGAFPGDAGRLREIARDHAGRLGTDETRVAASLLFQGLAARVWSPVVAAAALGVVPDLSGVRWRGAPGDPIMLGLAEVRGWRVGSAAEAVEIIHPMVVDGLLRPLREAMLGFVKLADGLVWGNAASALAGSLNVGPADPGRAAIVRALLAREPLTGAGSFGPRGFVRNNCCLYYRVPGGGMCGDCGLVR
ncbi:(2Fe-2S)-binding protein [Actinomadura mexicana]|uniref:(2Fe-2S)-binding protein n=1 Tax=Actinomadura mexicana TaxID=134959 RepID=UPI000B788CBB|nr:(2Fe-2S)-binding protein [Actinomadura mexicana]